MPGVDLEEIERQRLEFTLSRGTLIISHNEPKKTQPRGLDERGCLDDAAGMGPGAAAAPGNRAVRVWQATMTIPTYTEGPPNPNPPFDLFAWGRFNYPYTARRADRPPRARRLAQPPSRERVSPPHCPARSRRPDLQLPRQAHVARDVLREPLDQESADWLSRRLGGLRRRVQLPGLAQLGVDVARGLRDDRASRRERLDLGGQHRSGLRRALARGAAVARRVARCSSSRSRWPTRATCDIGTTGGAMPPCRCGTTRVSCIPPR